MEHTRILTEAARILKERGAEYGSPSDCFERIAATQSIILGRHVSRYEVASALFATKVGRMQESPRKVDTYIDLINYAGFMAEFVEDADSPAKINDPQPEMPLRGASVRNVQQRNSVDENNATAVLRRQGEQILANALEGV